MQYYIADAILVNTLFSIAISPKMLLNICYIIISRLHIANQVAITYFRRYTFKYKSSINLALR